MSTAMMKLPTKRPKFCRLHWPSETSPTRRSKPWRASTPTHRIRPVNLWEIFTPSHRTVTDNRPIRQHVFPPKSCFKMKMIVKILQIKKNIFRHYPVMYKFYVLTLQFYLPEPWYSTKSCSSWSIRPNLEDRKNRIPDDRKNHKSKLRRARKY